MPAEVSRDKIQHEGYTGPQGSKATNLTSTVSQATGNVEFETTQPLQAREGLTIVVGFPKGLVQKPIVHTSQEKEGVAELEKLSATIKRNEQGEIVEVNLSNNKDLTDAALVHSCGPDQPADTQPRRHPGHRRWRCRA